ncbi:MAG: amidohydrolase [Acidobacteriota bacterium]
MKRQRSHSALQSLLATFAAVGLVACASTGAVSPDAEATAHAEDSPSRGADDPYGSTYRAPSTAAVLIENAVILTGTGERHDGASLLLADGEVAAVAGAGETLEAPSGVRRVDAAGRWVTPGIIDVHSHLGVYPSPGLNSTQDGNEVTNPVTAQVYAEHSVWTQDPGFPRALAGGVTSLTLLPGSANLIGGRGVTVKNVPARTVREMKFPGAPYTLKMACGENPKRVYGNRQRFPSTRMGNFAGYRAAWIDAAEYRRKHEEYRKKKAAGDEQGDKSPPPRDLSLETLAGVLDGEILVQMHCYRAEEMAWVMDLAEEFGYRVSAFHHAVEAYKIADLLAREDVCAAMWADWWGFKLEAFDGIRENIALVEKAGACAIVHSDSERGIQRLNQEAAKAMAAGNRMGMDLGPEDAIRWITSNPARAVGIADRTGSLEVGKAADVVLWSGDPFSVYSRAERVWIDGVPRYDRRDPALQPLTDFELGLTEAGP